MELDVKNRNFSLFKGCFVEASAGTGKTYSIEHIVLRLLIEGSEPLKIDQILVVTFTREATRELTARIRSLIEKTIQSLQSLDQLHDLPDFLLAVVEKNERHFAIKYLQNALFSFDEANIFTIHSFCYRMLQDNLLEADLGVNVPDQEEIPSTLFLLPIIKDFMRIGLDTTKFSLAQLAIVLKNNGSDIEKLSYRIAKYLLKETEIHPLSSFQALKNRFLHTIEQLKKKYSFTAEKIKEDFNVIAPLYKGMHNKKKEIHSKYINELKAIAAFFTEKILDDNIFESLLKQYQYNAIKKGLFYHLENENLTQKALKNEFERTLKLYYPQFWSVIRAELLPIIEEAVNPDYIILRMTSECRNMFQTYFNQWDRMTADGILKRFLKALQSKKVTLKVNKKYQAAIVDEFQDTDALQWKILSRLFAEESKIFYLVGDPKQAIYAFRDADIYTYLRAQNELKTQESLSLDTNYRAHKYLVEALNELFSSKKCPFLMSLPKLKSALEVRKVKFSDKIVKKDFSDSRGSIHFMIAEGSYIHKRKWPTEEVEKDRYLSFITREIQRLHFENDVPLDAFAILIRDHNQRKRVSNYLNSYGIKCKTQRGGNLARLPIIEAMQTILRAVLHPQDTNILKQALGGMILGFSHQDICRLNEKTLSKLITQNVFLNKCLHTHDFAAFFEKFMKTTYLNHLPVAENILERKNGLDFYLQLQQLSSLLIEIEAEKHLVSDKLVDYLGDLSAIAEEEDPRLTLWTNHDEEAVNILTLHVSKGLEFEFVFGLGLTVRNTFEEGIISVDKNGSKELIPIGIDKSKHLLHCQEMDAEKARLFYVALTRAKQRLYLPIMLDKNQKKIDFGVASAMELYLAQRCVPYKDYETLYQTIQSISEESLKVFFKDIEVSDITHTYLNDEIQITNNRLHQDVSLTLKPPYKYVIDPIFMHSFTSISQINKIHSRQLDTPPHDFLVEEKNIHNLPVGSITGILLHRILEELDFKIIQTLQTKEEYFDLVDPYTQYTSYLEWTKVISEIVYDTFHTPLKSRYHSFALKDVNPFYMYKELEFLYPYTNEIHLDEIELHNGFLHGYIDLILAYKGYYYIIDYKTNWLGSSIDSYNRDSLSKSMQQNDYELQAAIYKKALKNYLALIDKRPFEQCFGGVFYLFLRGLNSNNECGIYYDN